MTRLPAWAKTPEAQAILLSIALDPPESSITRGTWIEGGGVRRYHGKQIARLRKIREQHLEALYAQPWEDVCHLLGKAAHEAADELVERLLDTRLTETIGDPFLKRFAA